MVKGSAFWVALGLLLGLRLLSMWLYPLVDTSEPRYADIARLMLQSNNWVTPWFSPGVPFWGKPPFAFWAEALSFKLFGLTELAVRLPSWLATLATTGLLYHWARACHGPRVGQGAVLIFVSCLLVFVVSGAVITDPFFALATTWAMVAYAMAQSHPHWAWRYGFFAALALGLLTKGPLVGVLVAGPMLASLFWFKSTRGQLKAMPWVSGFALMLLLSLPWYVLAELRTPGFLNYFLVGEHFLRFIDPGWAGDLYGSAHRESKGMIWRDALVASFPWGLVALALLLRHLTQASGRARLGACLRDPAWVYLLSWVLFSPLFFTLSGNILWTYVLPSLPALALVLALALREVFETRPRLRRALLALVLVAPLMGSGFFAIGLLQPMTLKTEKQLVQLALAQMQPQDQLAFVGPVPFSAAFYSQGRAITVPDATQVQAPPGGTLYLALLQEQWAALQPTQAPTPWPTGTQPITQSLRYVLLKLPSPSL